VAGGAGLSRDEKLSVRIAVKVSSRRFVLVDSDDVYYLESQGHDVLIRTARKGRLRNVRHLGSLEKTLRPRGFLRIHKSFVVNLDRVREVRMRRGDDNDWELKLDPPVNAVLPIGRGYLSDVQRVLGL
jgi:DNA-binding LytR/AlgR family response regulator